MPNPMATAMPLAAAQRNADFGPKNVDFTSEKVSADVTLAGFSEDLPRLYVTPRASPASL
jgi:hypothetical protein